MVFPYEAYDCFCGPAAPPERSKRSAVIGYAYVSEEERLETPRLTQ